MVAVPRAAPTATSTPPFSALHLVSDDTPLVRELESRLVRAGVRVTHGPSVPEEIDAIAFLDGLADGNGAHTATLDCFRRLRAFAQRHRERAVRISVVVDLGGDFGLRTNPSDRAAFAGIIGLAKTAAREWPNAKVKVIDVAASSSDLTSSADRLCIELLTTGDELEVGLSPSGERIVPALQPAPPSGVQTTRPLTEGGVWVVSGGARGVTSPCLQALARRRRLRFVLLGRTAIGREEAPSLRTLRTDAELKQGLRAAALARGENPTPRQLQQEAAAILGAREARETCEALRALGSEVRYETVDVANASAVKTVLDQVRQSWGPIRGFVHAAGVLADKALHEKTDEQFERVFTPKVAGLSALLEATRHDPLEVLCCFSSVAARAGNKGQADYAAANEILNKRCQAEQHRRGSACTVRAINWGPWDGGMVTPALKAHFASMGVAVIPIAGGAEAFADIVTGACPTTVECVVGGIIPGQPAV